MFRRRRSSSHHQPLSASSTQSAQSAASHAFLNSQPSSSSLSSAAAATALRSLSPTPTSPENVQTKRMIQRRSSFTSPPSLRSNSRNGLRRINSSSSMTTRSFREPSPRRPATSSGPVHAPHVPVPAIPAEYAGRYSSNRRSVSMEPHTRPMSPPRRTQTRGTSVDPGMRASAGVYNNRTFSLTSLTTVPETEKPELERSESRSSVNFSYPMGARPNSPPLANHDRREASAGKLTQLSSTEISNIQNRQPKKSIQKPSKVTPGTPERGPSVGTAVAAAQAANKPLPSNSSPVASRDVHDERPQPSRPAPTKRHSTVSEDRRVEEFAGVSSTVERAEPRRSRSPEQSAGSVEQKRKSNNFLPQPTAGPELSANIKAKRSSATQAVVLPESKLSPEINEASPRQPSSSPGRSARFSNRLSVTGIGDQLHSPPPRSVSPVKSAMKQSGSPKGSLSPERRVGLTPRPGPALSEISDGTSVASDEGYKGAKRKQVKVSFDDEAEIVGVAASPPTSPEDYVPEAPSGKSKKTSWFGVGKRRPVLDTPSGDEFDEVLKPRPALPSFGSIRGAREPESQGAIKEESDNESTTSSSSNMVVSGWSLSSDHAIGGILSNAPEDANRPSLEQSPLPSQPTGAPSYAEKLGENLPESSPSSQIDETPAETIPEQKQESNTTESTLPVPAIAVQPATPAIEKERSSLEMYSSVPGFFPRNSLEFDPKKNRRSLEKTDSTSVTFVEPAKPATETHTDDDSDSVYSDAAEDMEGDGFGSINAIVDGKHTAGDPFVPNDRSRIPDGITSGPEDSNQIGRATSPVQETTQPDPDSPGSANVRMPFSSAYPPLPGAGKSNTTKPARRPTSVGYNDAPKATERIGQERKKRPMSLGPIFKGKGEDKPRVNRRSANIARPTSSGSDSSSSFKRNSRPKRDQGSPFAMRRTMRNSSTNRAQSPPSVPASPSERRPLSSGSSSGNAMRTTLRGNGLPNGKASFFSTGKSPRAKVSKAPTTLFSSRFGDSDDEDGGQTRNFRSRFEDSSDEEGPVKNLRPVRGIPRRRGMHDGDSTELEDSSEEDKRPGPSTPAKKSGSAPVSPSGTSPLAAVAKARGVSEQELEDFLHQPKGGRVSGLFSRLSMRKSKNPDHKVRKSLLESPVRRDTPLGRSRMELDQIGEEPMGVMTTVTSNNQTEPGSPSTKLLKKNRKRVPEQKPQDKPEATEVNGAPNDSERPGTADGIFRNGSTLRETGDQTKEGQHLTNGTSPSPSPTALDIGFEGSGRKRRFPMLRKAFGLHR